MKKQEKVKIPLSPKIQRKIARIAEERKEESETIIEKINSFFKFLVEYNKKKKLSWAFVEYILEYKALLEKIPEREKEIEKLRKSIEEEKQMKKEYNEDYKIITELEKKLYDILKGDSF
ncbi:MAG: hypothetical protein K9W46_03700 [Candidatus Heimdallarchaeum endolithica]|uniref:Uncharacterized protein n=1 Tax=Candidatus Heimdallarchaeum endolithica TaxID=2876572 RepID=A0A9Y1FQ77_9ARCH|nr:MAG: hypothetical protein K9W46_03700 [Candidatus Heimdallarchaeum endolithica]